jgi:hypothetical protein
MSHKLKIRQPGNLPAREDSGYVWSRQEAGGIFWNQNTGHAKYLARLLLFFYLILRFCPTNSASLLHLACTTTKILLIPTANKATSSASVFGYLIHTPGKCFCSALLLWKHLRLVKIGPILSFEFSASFYFNLALPISQ